MNLKSIVLLLIISITQACGAKKNVNSRSETMWISGYQTICDKGTGKSECWLMTTSTNLATAKWEYFHNTIEGFNFEPGFIQKIEVKVKDSNEKLISADRSTLEYSLLKVLKKKKDTRVALQDHWYLERIIGLNTDETDEFPYLTFDLNKNSFSGSDGCNNFFGNIKHVGLQIINLERIFTTVRECDAKINSFNKIFNTITAYKIKKSALVFYDANKMKVMAFTKKKQIDRRFKNTRYICSEKNEWN